VPTEEGRAAQDQDPHAPSYATPAVRRPRSHAHVEQTDRYAYLGDRTRPFALIGAHFLAEATVFRAVP